MKRPFPGVRWAAALGLLPAWGVAPVMGAAPALVPPVAVRVDAASDLGPVSQAWAYFGYDACLNTFQPAGRELLGKLAALGPPVYVRTHNLLCDSDGRLTRRLGGTSVYRVGKDGRVTYDWTVMDKIFDAYRDAKVKPFLEVGFTPAALGTRWGDPPRDDAAWAELVHQWALHLMGRYGQAEVESWPWEVWNEADTGWYWFTDDRIGQYLKLYDYTVDAIKRASPRIQVGGPDNTGTGLDFLKAFLHHCENGRNAVTGQAGAPLDFVDFHAKGSVSLAGSGPGAFVRMGLANQLGMIDRNVQALTQFPKFAGLPVIIAESDPDPNAARSMKEYPPARYRERPVYGAYVLDAFFGTLDLFQAHHANLRGAVTWAFEFENEPYFSGLRELSSNGLDKPVLNAFRLLALVQGRRLALASSGSVGTRQILQAGGVRQAPDINGFAGATARGISVLLWNYHDDDTAAAPSPVTLSLENLPPGVTAATLREYRIDLDHADAGEAWLRLGSPATLTPEQRTELEAAGAVRPLAADATLAAVDHRARLNFLLPREGILLVQLSWP